MRFLKKRALAIKLTAVLTLMTLFGLSMLASGLTTTNYNGTTFPVATSASNDTKSLNAANTTVIAEGQIMGFNYRVIFDSFDESGTWNDSSTYAYNDSYDWTWAYEDYLTIFNESEVSNVQYYVSKQEVSENWWYYRYVDGYGLNQSSGDAPPVPEWDLNGYYVLNLTEEIANLTTFALNNGGSISIDKIKVEWPGSLTSLNGTWLADDTTYNYDWNITVHVPDYFTDPYTNTTVDLYIIEYWTYFQTFIPDSAIQTIHVNVSEISTGYYISNGTYVYDSTYNASFEAFSVEIWQDNGNFYLNYYAPLSWDYSSIDYYYYMEDYEYNYTTVREVRLLEDAPGIGVAGDVVPADLLPNWLKGTSVSYAKGFTESEYNSTGTTTSLTAMQYIGMSLWAVPQPVMTGIAGQAAGVQQDPYSYISVYWDNFIPAVLYAFRDNNNNGYLDLIANASSAWFLEPDVDTLEYVAYLESYSSNMTVSGFYFTNATSIWADEFGTYNDSYVINDTFSDDDWSFSYGPKPVPTTDVEAWFLNPVFDNLTNTLTFSWGVTYTDFPVSFYDWNSWEETQAYMDLEYAYDLRIVINDTAAPVISIAQSNNTNGDNTTSGNMDNNQTTTAYIYLDNTYYFGGLEENETIRSKMQGLSLANVIDTSFYSESVVQESNASSTLTTGTSGMSFESNGLILGSIDLKGRKADYTLMDPTGNQTYQASAAKIILFRESGSSTFNSTTLYEDHVSGNAETVITEQTYRYDYQWTQGLLIISYPEWNGYGVVHDPTFSAVSVVSTGSGSGGGSSGGGNGGSGGGSGGSGDDSGGSSDSETTVPAADTGELAPNATAPVPGLELVPALALIFAAAAIRGKTKHHHQRKRNR